MREYKTWCGEWRRMPACCNVCRAAVSGCLEFVHYENTHIDAYEIEVILSDDEEQAMAAGGGLSGSAAYDDEPPLAADDVFSQLCSPNTACSPTIIESSSSAPKERRRKSPRERKRRRRPPPPNGNPVRGDIFEHTYCFAPTAIERVELPDYRFLLAKLAAVPPR